VKKLDIENILKRRMLKTTDELFLAEPGTIEQSLLFLEFYCYERFRLLKMIEKVNKEENHSRWKFLNKKLAEAEDKIRLEKADIMLYEQLTNENLTDTTKDCKIYNINNYQKEEGE
tara:strand:- start:197 stop:544 length:348 start_codon:yes stop_codon:yes gene_type:complete